MAERDQRLTGIFHSAIEREGAERRAFLDGACAGDEELRREVESLIHSHEQDVSVPAGVLVGRMLGQYRVVSLIGSGGMGEVYLAEDTRLDRRVAIKILTSNFTTDAAQVRRFQQEARAASALNHPNIITVYDINESDGTQYIATELIEGETLRSHIGFSTLPLQEALDIVLQVAGALSAAHGAGVVHRDVKPENVMVRPDGYVKVLDFGIAKLTEQRRPLSQDAEAPTRALVKTGKGVVMGTAYYMSPEQARGHEVDARTDIWSLGVVLYEMVTSRLPFEGDTASDCIASILKTEPRPIADVPARLEWILQKALRKDPDERYQKVKEMLSDLRAVRQESDASAASLRSATSNEVSTDDKPLTPTVATVRTTSSAEYLVSEIKRHKRGVVLGLVVLVVVAAGVGSVLYKFAGSKTTSSPIFQNVTVSRVTTSGRAGDASISPDGKYLVYLEMTDDGNRSLVVKQTATGETLTIVPPTKGNVLKHTSFSPDGNFVYYLFTDRTKDEALYKVPSIGGTPQKLVDDCTSPVTFSPDGKRIAFVRESQSKSGLLVANADGTGERTVASLESKEWFGTDGPSWSPDGKTIANATGLTVNGLEDVFRLSGIDVETGAVRELSPKRWLGAGRVVWMPDGSSLVLTATERTDEVGAQVWRVAYPSGEAARITNDPQDHGEESLGVTADGRTILTTIEQRLSRIETIPATGDINQTLRLTQVEGNQEGLRGFDFTPDGRLVFSTFEGGQSDIWIMNADGSARRRLTSDSHFESGPIVSPDGRYVVFLSNRSDGKPIMRLWRMDIDGGNPVQLAENPNSMPNISRDGRWVIYSVWSAAEKLQSLWKLSIDGGQPVRLTDYNSNEPAYSPDEKWISCFFVDQQTNKLDYGIISASDGKRIRQFDFPGFQYQWVRWTTDGRHLSFIGVPPDPSNIWLQPAEGGAPRKLTDFKQDYIFRHAWSPDGKTLALVRGRPTSDVVLLKDNR